jgi:YVTN family beta-propeller protein
MAVLGAFIALSMAQAAPASAAAAHKHPRVIDTIQVGQGPTGVDVNPVTDRVYVTDFRADTVSVIDAATDQVVDTITVGGGPAAVAVNPVTNRIYVACQNAGIAVIDGVTDTVLTSIPVGSIPDGVAVDKRRNLVYASNLGGGTESVIDGATNQVVKTIQIGGSPFGVTVAVDANRIYVGNLGNSTVSVIDGATETVIDTIHQATIFGSNVSLDLTLDRLYVTGTANDIVVIDTTDDSVVTTVPVGESGDASRVRSQPGLELGLGDRRHDRHGGAHAVRATAADLRRRERPYEPRVRVEPGQRQCLGDQGHSALRTEDGRWTSDGYDRGRRIEGTR